MDIVTRLKSFIDSHRIPVTQFADQCGIPRPTLSQLLNGRNKKVSDEVVAKIHAAYPDLSIMWLLFGEGSMESGEQPVSTATIPENESLIAQPASDADRLDFTEPFVSQTGFYESERADSGVVPKEQKSTITFAPDRSERSGKRVVNIVVYYDDRSYESFVPDPSGRAPF